jgi:uroporphyrinogen-III synthase
LPVLAVGERTAAAARAAGFGEVHAAAGDRHGLAALARDRLPPGQRLLVAVGRDRKGDTAALLAGAGHDPILWTAYVARAVTVLPGAAQEALAGGGLDGVLHYSRRSAAIALSLARAAGLEAAFLTRRHICLSADVAKALRQAGADRLVIAKKPDEASLMAALDQAK